MIALDAADLVVIAGRVLGIGADAALGQMDIAAAQDPDGSLQLAVGCEGAAAAPVVEPGPASSR